MSPMTIGLAADPPEAAERRVHESRMRRIVPGMQTRSRAGTNRGWTAHVLAGSWGQAAGKKTPGMGRKPVCMVRWNV
jgi:hypothetical protein